MSNLTELVLRWVTRLELMTNKYRTLHAISLYGEDLLFQVDVVDTHTFYSLLMDLSGVEVCKVSSNPASILYELAIPVPGGVVPTISIHSAFTYSDVIRFAQRLPAAALQWLLYPWDGRA